MKDANPNLYEKHRSYALSFEPEWRYNDNLMSLLIAIALFNPDRNGICDIHKIRYNPSFNQSNRELIPGKKIFPYFQTEKNVTHTVIY